MLPIGLVFIGIVLSLCVKYTYTGNFRLEGLYLPDGYSRLFTMMMSVGIYLCFSMELVPRFTGLFNKIGQNTMGIYYLHYPMLIVLHLVCDKIFPSYTSYYSFALNFIQTVIVMTVCLFITIGERKIAVIKEIFSYL